MTCRNNIYHNNKVFSENSDIMHYQKDQNNLEGPCAVNADCLSNNCAYGICCMY